MNQKFRSIELFAGCGGMSLGFQSENYELVFANELSPMASETFAFNLLGEDLKTIATYKDVPKKVLWLSSDFPRTDIAKRLNERPLIAKEGLNCDIDQDSNLNHKLIVGNIIELNRLLKNNENLIPQDIDVVSGGPPCQSFSMSGLRKKDDPKNQLPFAFAEFVSLVKPKFVVLENVTGILRPFVDDDKNKYHAWIEISRYFVTKGYVPICLHVNSKYVGVPQARPRFIMIGIENSIALRIKKNLEAQNSFGCMQDFDIVHKAIEFFESPNGTPILYDIHNLKNQSMFDQGMLSLFKTNVLCDVKSAIGDLVNQNIEPTYSKHLSLVFKNKSHRPNLIANQENATCTEITTMRFKLYQIISKYESKERAVVKMFLSGELDELPIDLSMKLLNEEFIIKAKPTKISSVDELNKYLVLLKTKKRSQMALDPNKPSPTIQSNPDDLIHYQEPRPINVREMARLQSFPDWFVFKSKRTTGGDRRRFEVPQQTQVGNAVPPLLAKQIAKFVSNLLTISKG
jgi:DNA (cytosine-5)-methyltransferase 1